MQEQALDLTILVPVYQDEEALVMLLDRLDGVLAKAALRPRILIVDDGSPDHVSAIEDTARWTAIRRVEVIELRANVGHQRAIAIGLSWLEKEGRSEAVVVMDGDGEDDPRDVPRLVEQLRKNGFRRIVFAERTKRSETMAFRASYWLYRQVHFLLTGVRVRVGNFSVIPRDLLGRLVTASQLWNHYAATVFRTRTPFESIRTERAKRLAGASRMNFVALGVHGLSALSLFGETIGVRLGLAFGAGIALSAVVLVVLIWQGVAELSLSLTALGLGMLFQTGTFLLLFVFLTLQGRSNLGFLPARDYVHFVGGVRSLFERGGADQRSMRALKARVG